MLLFAGELIEALFNLRCKTGCTLLRFNVSVVEIFNKVRHSITPYRSDLLMILMSSSSTSSVGIPSERSILRNSFNPLIKRLHSKSVSFSLVFLLNIKKTSLYLVIPFYKEVCVLSNVWDQLPHQKLIMPSIRKTNLSLLYLSSYKDFLNIRK